MAEKKPFLFGLNFLCTLPVVEVTKIALPGVLVVKNLPASAGRHKRGQSGRSPGGGHGNPFQCLAWRIPWTEELGRLQSIGLHRVRHD